jgi:hypothetical protein
VGLTSRPTPRFAARPRNPANPGSRSDWR